MHDVHVKLLKSKKPTVSTHNTAKPFQNMTAMSVALKPHETQSERTNVEYTETRSSSCVCVCFIYHSFHFNIPFVSLSARFTYGENEKKHGFSLVFVCYHDKVGVLAFRLYR